VVGNVVPEEERRGRSILDGRREQDVRVDHELNLVSPRIGSPSPR
jgi:hypothetical protein